MMQDAHMKLKPQLPWQSWIKNWSQQPTEVLGTLPYKLKIFRNRVRKAIINQVK